MATSKMLADEQTTLTQLYDALCNKENATLDHDILSAVRSLTLTPARRAALFASLWASGRRALLKKITETLPAFTEPQVLGRAATLLDQPRRERQFERRVLALEASGANQRTMRRVREKLAAMRTEGVPASFSASRAFKAVLIGLLKTIPSERLEFDLLFFENGPWRGLCDLTHTKPGDWTLPYLQSSSFGEPAPEGSLLADVQGMTKESLPALLAKHPVLRESYSHVRVKLPAHARDGACNVALATHCPLADVIWYYEELAEPAEAVDAVIARRLGAGEALDGKMKTDNFGKLMERLLLFRQRDQQRRGAAFWPSLMPLAEKLLAELKARRLALVRGAGPRSLQELAAATLHDEAGPAALAAVPEAVAESVPAPRALRVAVLGDASASMQTAINSATIVGAMMTAVFEAELVFFNNKAFKAKVAMPSSAAEVLAVTEEVRAGSSTAPAAALLPFYEAKQKIDLFLVVTDEEENTGHDGSWAGGRASKSETSFAGLFAKYLKEVHPHAKASFVSFLRGAADGGQMVDALKARGIAATQMRMDGSRPDLSKFDAILGSVMLDAQQQVERAAAQAAVAGAA